MLRAAGAGIKRQIALREKTSQAPGETHRTSGMRLGQFVTAADEMHGLVKGAHIWLLSLRRRTPRKLQSMRCDALGPPAELIPCGSVSGRILSE